MKRVLFLSFIFAATLIGGLSLAENQVSTLRGQAELDEVGNPEAIPKIVNSDVRQVRNYPEQPPLIPHKTDGYQIDRNVNQCLQCHQRTAVEATGAPMVSVTHFMDRENQVLAQISPRRYFCTQCHVTQHNVRPLLKNNFVDAEEIIEYLKSKQQGDQ